MNATTEIFRSNKDNEKSIQVAFLASCKALLVSKIPKAAYLGGTAGGLLLCMTITCPSCLQKNRVQLDFHWRVGRKLLGLTSNSNQRMAQREMQEPQGSSWLGTDVILWIHMDCRGVRHEA